MKLKPIPVSSFKSGDTYPYDVYLQINDAKVIQIYKANFEVSSEDMDRLNKFPEGKILVSKEDHSAFFETKVTADLSQQLHSGGPIDHKKAESLFCYALYREEDCNDQDFISDVIKKSQSISLTLFDTPNMRNDKVSNFNILNELSNSEERFAAHSQMTLTLGSLFMLATPGVTMDELTNIGHVAFLHGFSMEYLSDKNRKTVFHKLIDHENLKIDITKDSVAIKDAIEQHLNGHSLNGFNAISAYLKHFHIMEKALEKSAFGKNAGTVRAIKEFKQFETPPKYRITNKKSNYFIVTSKFIIVDHLVTLLNQKLNQANTFTSDLIGSCLSELKTKVQDEGALYEYDHKLLDTFIEHSRSMA